MHSTRTTLLNTGTIHISQGLDNLCMNHRSLIHDIQKNLFYHKLKKWQSQPLQLKKANHQSLEKGGRIITEYKLESLARLLIITEACRSFTTIMLASEF